MRSQERENAVRLKKMARYRLRIQQLTLTIRSTLHTKIIANNRYQPADRHAALFRALLGIAVGGILCDTSRRRDVSMRRATHLDHAMIEVGGQHVGVVAGCRHHI